MEYSKSCAVDLLLKAAGGKITTHFMTNLNTCLWEKSLGAAYALIVAHGMKFYSTSLVVGWKGRRKGTERGRGHRLVEE